MKIAQTLALAALVVAAASPSQIRAQQATDNAADRKAVAAVVDSSLAAISRGDMVKFTDLMVDEAVTMSVRQSAGRYQHAARSREANRTTVMRGRITERAFATQVQVQGAIATAWAPYDLYIDDKWSHCGIDVFTLIKTGGTWKIATMVWSVDQPPVCDKHPSGPPKPPE